MPERLPAGRPAMSATSPPPRPSSEYRIGDRVPLPKPKLDVRPAHWVDDPKRGPRGVFTNGSDGVASRKTRRAGAPSPTDDMPATPTKENHDDG